MKKGRVCLSVLFLFCFFNKNAFSDAVENCIGNICLDEKSFQLSQFLREYGSGEIKGFGTYKGEKLDGTHCYFIPEKSVWLKIEVGWHLKEGEIEGVMISRESLCNKKYKPRKQLGQLVTKGGIGLGSMRNEVINVYGRPNRIDNLRNLKDKYPYMEDYSRYGQDLLVYFGASDSLLGARYYLKNDVVHSMEITNSE